MPSYIDGRKIEDFYDIGHKIGSGGFSTVRSATSKADKKECAVKIIQKKALGSDLELVGKEIDIMRRIDHPHVIKLFDIFETSSHIYMVLELVTGGELFDRIVERGFFSEQDARDVIRCMLSAVDYLHKENIVHRDLKPENLLCTSREVDVDVKLADFGLSTVFDEQTILSTTCGTPGYVAPEVLMQRGYGKEVDLWSIGVIAYILFCGFPPFYSEDQNELFQQIITAKFDFPEEYWGSISSNAKDLVKGFLTADPAQRLTVAGALKHPFMMEDQSTTAIPGMAEHLEESILKKKFRAAAMTIEAVNRMARAVRFMQEMVEEKKAKQAAAGTAAAAGAFKKLKKQEGPAVPAPPSGASSPETPSSPVQTLIPPSRAESSKKRVSANVGGPHRETVVKGPASNMYQLSKGRGIIMSVWAQVFAVLLLSVGSGAAIWVAAPERDSAAVGFPLFVMLTWGLPAGLGLLQGFLVYFGVKAHDAAFLKAGAQVSMLACLTTGVVALYGALVMWVLGPDSEFAAVAPWTAGCSYTSLESTCFAYTVLVVGLVLSLAVHVVDMFVVLNRSRTLRDMQTLHQMIETEEHYEWMRSLRNIFLNRSAPPPPTPPS